MEEMTTVPAVIPERFVAKAVEVLSEMGNIRSGDVGRRLKESTEIISRALFEADRDAEARGLMRGMGVLLAVIDMAHSIGPPPGTSPRKTLDDYADMAEVAARVEFGDQDWDALKAATRALLAPRKEG